MSYNYTTYKLALQTLIASQSPDVDFDNILPSCIDYAEQRIYRELNLLQTVQGDVSLTCVVGQRTYTIPDSFVAVNIFSVLTPAGATETTGNRASLVPVSLDAINFLWPGDPTVTGLPVMFAMQDQWTVIVGPPPDATYNIEIIGTYRPTPLSSANPTTFLTDRLPDLFMAASMVFMSGYMRNFGTQASDPQMGMSWEQQYKTLFESANGEELRKHYWASSWSAYPVSPAAQPQRG
jgi:hypothetical protein